MARSKNLLLPLGFAVLLAALFLLPFLYPPPPDAAADNSCEEIRIEIVDEVPSDSIGEINLCGLDLWCAPPAGTLYVCQVSLGGDGAPPSTLPTAVIPNPIPGAPLQTPVPTTAPIVPVPTFAG